MKIGIPKEVMDGETRVAVVPSMVPALKKNHEVFLETGAGTKAFFQDSQYKEAGATIIQDTLELYNKAEVIFKFQAPQKHPVLEKHEVELLKEGSVLLSSLSPKVHKEIIPKLLERQITSFAMEYIPRITKAQSMDVLSAMSTVAGYKAVLIAANHLAKFFPLLMTAAGTIPPANVLVLGAGVAGLQSIATARRLGAKVEAFDPRPAVKEQIESIGAKFVEMTTPGNIETEGGYAKEQPEEFLQREREVIGARLQKADALITTAEIFGKRAPILVTEEMIQMMKPGSVIVDLASAEGGNCELTEPNKTIEKNGVTIFGPVNLARTVPIHASQMHSKNMINLFQHLFRNGTLDFEDIITKGSCITHKGKIVNEMVKKSFHSGESTL